MVTPRDIAEKGFKISFRGYNTEEVDDFLQDIYDSYIEIYRANQKLNETTGRLSDAVGQYKSMEDTLNDALNIAGKSADEIEESARSKAAEIIKNAEIAANSIIAGAEQKIAAEEYRLENIKRETETYKAKIKELLNAQLCILNEYPQSASLDSEGSAPDKAAPMWKKHKNSAKSKKSSKESSDITDTKQTLVSANPEKLCESVKIDDTYTDTSKTTLFEPVKANPTPKAEEKSPKSEEKFAEADAGVSNNSATENSAAEPSYEEMKEKVFGHPSCDTSKLPCVSINENGEYTVRK